MPFEPGKSGNPNGSAGPRRFQAAIERALAQDDGKKLRAAVDKMLTAASKGEPWAIQFLAERLDGKATQTVSIIRDACELSDADLGYIAAAGSDRIAETQSGAKEPSSVH
jgi:Family of unknown function (DUF5681)